MIIEQELKNKCTQEFIKWMCKMAEGFEFIQDKTWSGGYYITTKEENYYKWSYNSLDSDDIILPLLIHRAVEGWNKITRNKYIIITDTFLYTTSNLHQGDERYNYNNYQPQSLTQCECAMLHCLLEISKQG
jgi:hypothetical protein